MTSDSFAAVIKEFKQLLRQIFRLDGTGDLDFGIYRVINEKANFLRDFIGGLNGVVEAALVRAGGDREAAEKTLREMAEKVKKTLDSKAIDNSGKLDPKYAETGIGKDYLFAQQRAGGIAVPNLEADICNHLLRFFERCYRDGDFMPQRKISNRGVYSLPYNGEDVFLHWANRGQYYIKTSENFSSYGFTVPGETAPVRVCFVVCEAADMPDNNNKGGRSYFFPQIADMAFVGNELRVPIHYRAPNDKDKLDDGKKPLQKPQHVINAKAAAEAEKIIPADFPQANGALKPDGDASADADAPKTVFHQKLNHYTRRHETDFFIHKNLREFLLRELESSVKNEVINLDEIQADNLPLAEARLISARAILDIGGKIIAHLAQFEDFQKTLWEKKKFITETNYIVRLGAAMESLSAQQKEAVLAEVCKGEAQWEEWRKLNLLGENSAALFANNKKTRDKARRDVLSACLSLPLDTAHFGGATGDVALSLLSAFDDLEEATDGVLFHGENWQALNLLQGKYRGAVNCVYIDPPYNTDASAIIYKNDYKDSSWLSLMFDRLSSAKEFLTAEGILCCAIDDAEVWRLRAIMEGIFENEIGIAPVRSNPAGRKSSGQFSPAHEYALFYGNEESIPGSLEKTEKALARYPLEDKKGNFAWANFVRSGSGDKREDRPKMFYPIFVNDKDEFRIPKMKWDENKVAYSVLESPRKGEVAVYPIRQNGGQPYEGRWHRGYPRVIDEPDEFQILRSPEGEVSIHFKTRIDEESMPITWWEDKRYASANYGAIMLKNFFGEKIFDFAKSVELVKDCLIASGANDTDSRVLDFFAGSGTTGHAVVNLNREDGGRRKFILAEMGDYFDRVLLRRLKKIVFAPDWKDGKPANQPSAAAVARGPRVLKYHRLESYEDALDNVEFAEVDKADLKLFGAEFQHRYMLRWESSGSATFAPGGLLDSPFTYALPRAGKEKVAHADLPETFYYMAGIRIQSREATTDSGRRYQIDLGDYHGEPSAFIWRDCANWTPEDCDRERNFFAARKELQGRRLYVNGGTVANTITQITPLFNALMFGETEKE